MNQRLPRYPSVAGVLAFSFFLLAAFPAAAQLPPPQEEAYCWAVADSGDSLIFINKDGDGFNDRGLTGTSNIESIAFNPGDGRLYTANDDNFGYLDYDDAFDTDSNDSEFVAIGTGVGTVTLPDGSTDIINDIDGLQFDITRFDVSTNNFVLWATDREGGNDILFQIDPGTGLIDTTPTPGFSNGASAVRVTGVGSLVDIDDIAADPLTGILYGINNAGGVDDQFGIIDPVTGAFRFVSVFKNTAAPPALITDMEGFSFSMTGQLYGTSGNGSTVDDTLWLIDKETGDTTEVNAFSTGSDYESVACLTDNVVSGTVYFDLDADNSYEPGAGEIGFSNATVRIHIDVNNDGLVDAGDMQLCDNPADTYNLPCPVTDGNGYYVFPVGQGNFVVDVDVSTVPSGSTLTHPTNAEPADFANTDFGQLDPNNNFGFTLPTGSGDLDLVKTSNVVTSAVQGQTITYTVTATNNTTTLQTGIRLTDALPAGVTAVAATTSATGPAESFLLDAFNASSFSGNNGTRSFAGDWTEANEEAAGAGAGTGQIQVVGNGMRLDDEPDSAGNPQVSRTADLTGMARALFSFDFQTSAGVDAADSIRVEVSDGGVFNVLEDITGISGAVIGSRVYDISGFISATTTVRLTVLNSYNGTDEFFTFDQVEIRDASQWLDRWESQAYNNSDGNAAWATDWLEIGEADGEAIGDVLQTTFGGQNVVRVQNADRGLQREADLSSYASARLSFNYRRDGLDNANDLVTVEVSANGGGNWTELTRLRGGGNDSSYQFLSFDISKYISANTRIRFLAGSALDGTDRVYFDDVLLDVRDRQTTTRDNIAGGSIADLVDGSVPALIAPDDRYILSNGESLTVTFDVVVDNPLSPSITSLENTAQVTSEQNILPTTAMVTDPVVRGTIGNFVWNDLNGDGVQDGGAETGIDSVVLELSDGACALGVSCPVAVTSAGGIYSFTNLAPGTYAIHLDDTTLPAGLVLSSSLSDPITGLVITGSENIDTADFGYVLPGTVFGHLYLDTNGNGNQDGGEPDLVGVDVIVTDSGAGTQTVTSNGSGDWTASVIPGSTTANVDETDPDYPAGATQTEGTDPTTVTAVGGASVDAGIDGYTVPASVFGHLYLDTNGNGNQDGGEPNLVGVDVIVTDSGAGTQTVTSNGSGDWTASVIPGSTSANVDETDPDFPAGATQTEGTDPTTVTAVGGSAVDAGIDGYTVPASVFGHLYLDTNGNGNQDGGEPNLVGVDVIVTDSGAGTQTVTSNGSGDWTASVIPGSTSANVDETDPDFPAGATQTEGTDPTTVTAVGGSAVDAGIDGYTVPASVFGHLYLDTNGNGNQDGGEPDLVGVDVIVTDSGAGTQTVTSNGSGDWTASVIPGSTSANVDETDPDFPAGATQTEGTDPTTVTAVGGSAVDAGIDGYTVPASVFGHLYLDTNGNGNQDGGEPDLVGVDVIVTDSGAGTQTVTSNGSGDWTASVIPGSTTANVDETDPDYPAGATQTEGTDPTTVTAVGGASVDAGIDGYTVPASVFGHLYLDTNGNGNQDGGEPNLVGVDVIVTDSAAGTQTVTSNGSGDWTASVIPGSTSANVDETDPDFPAGATQTEGTDPTTVTAVGGSAVDAGIDGYTVPASVFGHLYLDTNGNGNQDGGEPNLVGVDVIVTDSGAGTQTVTSNGSGDWTASVIPGSTSANVDETDPDFPAGATQTEGTDPTTVTAVGGSAVDAGIDGYTVPASVFGHLYLDTNGNGNQDGGEPNLVGVDVIVTDSGAGTQTVTSNGSGDWTASVIPGSTSANVDETDPDFPAGATQTEGTDPTTVTAVGGSAVDAGIDGYTVPASVFGHLYLDTNGNGNQDGGEPDLVGVDVIVTDSGAGTQTVTSNGSGDWTASVIPGSTTANVDETDPDYPAGATQTEGTDPTTVTAVGGSAVDAGIDGYTVPASVFGHLYLDTNGNGNQDGGEPDLVGVDVIVTDSGAGTQTVTSNGSGDWTAGVIPGSTTANVDETDPDYPAGATQTEGTDPTTVTAVGGSAVDAGIDGYMVPATISVHLFIDSNGNTIQDTGEPDLANVDVIVTDSGSATQTVTSNASGDISAGVPAGVATLDVVDATVPIGHVLTTANDPQPVTAVSAADIRGSDIGYQPPQNPVIGISKRVTSLTAVGSGQWDVSYEMLVENMGDVDLSNVQVVDNLAATFPAPVTTSIQAAPAASGSLTANQAFDGLADQNLLLSAGSFLAVGDQALITVVVRFDPAGLAGPFNNTATVSGTSPDNTTVTDISDDGTEPDDNSNGDPGDPDEGTPTSVAVPNGTPPPLAIPTLGPWGLLLLVVMVLLMASRSRERLQ